MLAVPPTLADQFRDFIIAHLMTQNDWSRAAAEETALLLAELYPVRDHDHD